MKIFSSEQQLLFTAVEYFRHIFPYVVGYLISHNLNYLSVLNLIRFHLAGNRFINLHNFNKHYLN
jgi:hypothetical protein